MFSLYAYHRRSRYLEPDANDLYICVLYIYIFVLYIYICVLYIYICFLYITGDPDILNKTQTISIYEFSLSTYVFSTSLHHRRYKEAT